MEMKKEDKNTDRAVFEICGVILSGYVRNRNVLSGASGIKSHDRIYAACQLCGAATDRYTEEIRAAGTDVEALIPDGCRYGIYDAAGRFKTGTFSADAKKRAWQGYKNSSKYASMGKYYRYIKQNSGDICIVKYDLHMRYAYDKLNGIVPSLEILTPVLGVVLFFLHATLLSGHFAKKLKRELRQLREVTEKIGQNDLEFETTIAD